MTPPDWIKRHPLLTGVLVMLVLASLWIGYFLASFDLNDYRGELQSQLGELLDLSVHLGDAQLRLRDAGIAITFNNVTLGDDTSAIGLETGDLWLLFEWSALFRQELRFSKIGMLQPTVRLDTAKTNTETLYENGLSQMFAGSHVILEGLSIQSLEIRDGRFLLKPPVDQTNVEALVFENVDIHIGHFAQGQTTTLVLTAALLQSGQPARVNVTGTAALPVRLTDWKDIRLDLNIDLTHLAGTMISQIPALALHDIYIDGETSVESRFVGSFADGLSCSSKLADGQLTLKSQALPAPYPVEHLQFDGIFSIEEDHYQYRELSIQLDGIRLTGEASLRQEEANRQLDLQFNEGILPLSSLAPMIPSHSKSRLSFPSEGSLWLERGRISFQIDAEEPAGTTLQTAQLSGVLENVIWHPAPAVEVSLTKLNFDSDGPLWKLTDGKGSIGAIPLGLHGIIDLTDINAPDIDLTLTGTAQSKDLLSLFGKQPEPSLTISGAFPFAAKLKGHPAELGLDFDVHLDTLDLAYGKVFHFPPTVGSKLQLHSHLAGQSLKIDHASLHLPPAKGRISGQVDLTDKPEMALKGVIEITDAAALQPLQPRLKKLQLSGGAHLDFTLKGPLTQTEHQAILTLHDVGFSMRGIMADISKVQGRIHLTDTGLESEEMLARIGDSPVTFKARLDDLKNPNLILDLYANQVRADELIFYSDQITLHDLSSRLEIAPGKVVIALADVSMPNGTRARVSGQVATTPHIKVELDISSGFADIEEVIGLWSRLSPEARTSLEERRAARAAQRKPYEVIIKARADKGNVYGMHFQNAVGTIEQKPGQLVIHPLSFNVDKGLCTSQVIVDFFQDKPPLMRISGHAQDVDAYRIYNELLKQKGILKGRLSGDFYLQGEIGKTYLPSSLGSFDVVLRDGVLKKFHVLSKVFSLLNVSQLFALKLPDMDLEGMPYDKITGNLVMKNGVLSSEKLLVESEAMNQSYIGKFDLVKKQIDLSLAIQPLRTVDKILSRIPIAGWLLTGEEKALITTHFAVKGPLGKAEVSIQPVTSISEKTLGLIRRTLGLPVKLVTDPAILFGGGTEEK